MAYAFFTKVQKVRPHSNADRLDVATVFGFDTIVSKGSWEAGDECIYFASGGIISPEYLSKNNMYRHSELNEDKSVTGYFEDSGRVKAMKLRGEMSDGVIMHVESLQDVIPERDWRHFEDGQEIDKVGNITLAQKYIAKRKGPSTTPSSGRKKKKAKKYMPEHIDTSVFAYNTRRFAEPCQAHLSFKLHGTSGRFSHIKKRWWQFWKPRYISGSRRVEFQSFKDPGFYGTNEFRKHYHDKLSKIVPVGYTLYFEIVGWVNDTTPIMPVYNTDKLDKSLQKEFGKQMIFSYGCEQGEHKMYVYRITDENDRELSPKEIREFCEERDLKVVPPCLIPSQFDYEDWVRIDSLEDLLHAINYIFKDYRDRIDSSHLLEGIVIRRKNELGTWEAYKHKTNDFKIIENIEHSGIIPEGVAQDVLEEMS